MLGHNCRHILTTNLNYQDPAVTAQLPQEHWLALLRRGIDPVYIDTTDQMLLFQFVIHLASDGKMLRNHQHTYDVARDTLAFYIQNANRLIDITAGRLLLIADTIRNTHDKTALAARLAQMLRKDNQRDVQLEPATVQVLLWPKRPPKRRPKGETRRNAPQSPPESRTAVPDPEPIIDPAPETEPLTAEWVAREPASHDEDRDIPVEPSPVEVSPDGPDPEPDPDPPTSAPLPSAPDDTDTPANDTDVAAETDTEPLTLGQAIRLLYCRRERGTCESVAAVLRRCDLAVCDQDDFFELAERLQGVADWDHDNDGTADAYYSYEPAPVLFASRDGVLLYRDHDLCILTWDQVREIAAPVLAERKKRRDLERRENEARAIVKRKLPKVRKLKAMKSLLDELLALRPDRIRGEALIAFDFIRRMARDDERFADCKTFHDYLTKAAEIARLPGILLLAPT